MTHHRLHRFPVTFALGSALALALGCGDNVKLAAPDGGPPPEDAPYMACGDNLITGSEECDDGNESEEDECLNDCTLACGDGRVNAVELCDTAIPAGMPGACPGACDDTDACTTDLLVGSDCQVACVFDPVTAAVDDDGCCPPGEDANSDNDCLATCGNGVLEMGETCETAIPAGTAGSCPVLADCTDGAVCTTDAIDNDGTCQAACRFDPITLPANNDGCCPPGADLSNDNDCSASCGDGVVSPTDGETCDIAIPAGMPGACPGAADCDDSVSCTRDALTSAGTCMALCTHTPITTPDNSMSDGCCPPAGNANNDLDCMPVCGNNAVETGEGCDDGNVMPGDGCDGNCQLEPTAFRITNLLLRDPHAVTLILGIACSDITSNVNTEINNAIGGDADGDGLLDFSPVNLFRPLDRTAMMTPMDVIFADCTAPASSTTCSEQAGNPPIESNATNRNSGTCLAPIPGTVRPYNPGVTSATSPCYSSDPESLTIDLGGILVPLTDARVGATYMGNPTTGLVNGLLEGFISEADAEATMIPASIPIVGGRSLASILPGGTGNCSSNDDRDTGPDGTTSGWWLYFNFTGTRVPWILP